jgi:hypothetical protein
MYRKKRVSFHFARDVWIIPNNDDIKQAGLKDDLWWSENETDSIRKTAIRELNKISLFNSGYSWKNLSKIIWYILDFDTIYEMLETYKLTNKIELKKLCDLYTIKSTQ